MASIRSFLERLDNDADIMEKGHKVVCLQNANGFIEFLTETSWTLAGLKCHAHSLNKMSQHLGEVPTVEFEDMLFYINKL